MDEDLNVVINYENEKAVSSTFKSVHSKEELQVFLKGSIETRVLGDFELKDNTVLFIPLVPFTPGNTYEYYKSKTRLGEFTIADLQNVELPKISTIYPSTDTVPENLLKMYFEFSKPMQEVKNALDFIEVYNVTDKLPASIFLELQNELWNEEHTRLTLWLDPGRIKTDLIPNRTKGLPIEEGKQYSIRISNQWRDAENNTLDTTYVKTLFVTAKDHSKIALQDWSINPPTAKTTEALCIDMQEPIDAILALETMYVLDKDGHVVNGAFKGANKERRIIFVPTIPWKTGLYTLVVNSILEDLAGNNLNHLFDVDLTKTQDTNQRTKEKVRSFKVM